MFISTIGIKVLMTGVLHCFLKYKAAKVSTAYLCCLASVFQYLS